METCARCGSGLVYRFNDRPVPDSTYVYVCVGAGHHVHVDPATSRSDSNQDARPLLHTSRILERRPLRAGGLVATA